MASHVYYKFRAQISWDPISFDGHFVSVGELKRLICEKKSLGDAASELVLSDPNSNTEYTDDSAQIPKGTRVILRRVPPNRARVLVAATPLPPQAPPPQTQAAIKPAGAADGAGGSAAPPGGGGAGDDFGEDPFAQSAANLLQEQAAARSLALVAGAAAVPGKSDRDRPGSWGLGGRGGPGTMRGGGGRGRGPAVSYICRRCGEQGKHWEKDCSTVGDPAYDYKTVRMPTGIPVTKLQRNADGSLYLPTGELGELAPNQAAFRKELALMTGAAAAEQAAVTEPASQLAALMPPAVEPAVNGAAAAEALPTGGARAGPPAGPAATAASSAAATLASYQSKPAAADASSSGRDGVSEQIKPEQREIDLFDDDEQPAAAIPISLGAEREQPVPSPIHTNGAADVTDQDVAKLWDSYHAVKEILPAGTTFKMWRQAFGAGRPLTPSEFKQFQLEHKNAAAKSAKPSRQSQEREREPQHGARAPSREPEPHSPTHALDQRERMRSRSRSRSRGRDKRSPVSWRSRSARRTPSVQREDEEPSTKVRADGERRLAKATAPSDDAGGGQRRGKLEDRIRLPVKQADDDVESAGRKRPRSSSEEVSERKSRDQDRYRPQELEDQKQSRSSPDAVAEQRHSSESGREVADEGTSREGEQTKHEDSKKSKKKHRKEHKKRKDKHHKKEHKSRRRSRSSSPPAERGRSVGRNDRYVPSDHDAPNGDDDDRDGEVASSRRRRKTSRDGRRREDRSAERAPDRVVKKLERPAAPGPGNLFHRALSSVERSNSGRR